MRYVLSRYNNDYGWVDEYTDDVVMYDRGTDPAPGSIRVPNIGNADFDRLTYIIDHYDDMPDVFLLSKCNLFQFITKEEFDKVKDNRDFTPLLTQNHRTYEPICRYAEGIYQEINNSWYVPQFEHRYATYNEWAREFDLPTPEYLSFAPGGNYIVTKDRIHRYPQEFYKKMRDTLGYTQLPAEAHFVERTYYTLWS